MSAKITTFEQLGKTLINVASEYPTTVMKTLNEIADQGVDDIKNNAPVDTGFMKSQVVKQKVGTDTVKIIARAPYSIYVDKGHKTRSGSTVPPTYFFSNIIDQIKIDLPNILQKNLLDMLENKKATQKPRKYIGTRISKKTGKEYKVYAKKLDSLRGRRSGRISTR